MNFSSSVCGLAALTLLQSVAAQATQLEMVHVVCNVTGSIQGEYSFVFEGNDITVKAGRIFSPDWGELVIDSATETHIAAHLHHGTSDMPNAVFSVALNRATGKGSFFFSKEYSNPLELYINGFPLKTGDASCHRAQLF